MNTEPQHPSSARSVVTRQLVVLLGFVALFLAIVLVLYIQDRQKEWRIHREQATHRLDFGYEAITNEMERVRSDAFFLAELNSVRQYVLNSQNDRERLESTFSSFVNRKRSYDQIRLLDLSGTELARVDFTSNGVQIVPADEMQDKSSGITFRNRLTCPAVKYSYLSLI